MEAILQQPQFDNEDQAAVYKSLVEDGYTQEEALGIIEQYCTSDAPEQFAVTDMSSANWVLKMLANIDASASNIQEMIDNEVAAIQRRGQKLLEPLVRDRQFFVNRFGAELKDFAEKELQGKKTKTLKLLHGKLSFMAGSESLVIDNEEATIAQAEMLGIEGAVKTTKTLLKPDLKKWLKNNNKAAFIYADKAGNEIKLAHIERSPEKFSIDPSIPEGND